MIDSQVLVAACAIITVATSALSVFVMSMWASQELRLQRLASELRITGIKLRLTERMYNRAMNTNYRNKP